MQGQVWARCFVGRARATAFYLVGCALFFFFHLGLLILDCLSREVDSELLKSASLSRMCRSQAKVFVLVQIQRSSFWCR
ncbi:expressed protein [Echinococcus multilocularis]|uniref:Expressed protein n=1 Tax=Echinococcus multilocularis TaxID=6211 RepID=A0A068YDQ5_ECHMU|nr:expressed protein [Echinococcus multilocularis]